MSGGEDKRNNHSVPNENDIPSREETARKSTFSASADELRKPVKRRAYGKGKMALIGLCAVILLSGAAFGLTKLTKTILDSVGFSNVWLNKCDIEDITEIKMVAADGATLTLTRDGDHYAAVEIAPEVLSQENCNTAFINAAELLAEEIAAENVVDLKPYGLEEPVSVFTVRTDSGDFTLEIGGKAPTSSLYYARKAGESTVYLIKGLLVNLYAGGAAAYRDLNIFAVNLSGIAAFRIERAGQRPLHLTFQSKTAGFRFTQWQIEEPFLADAVTGPVEELLLSIGDIRLTRYVDTAEELAAYGLDAPAQMVKLIYRDGAEFILHIGNRDERGNANVRIGDSTDVYLVSAEKVAFVDGADVSPLISEFSNIHAITGLTALTVELDGKTAEFTADRTGDEAVYMKNGVAMEDGAFQSAFQSVNTIAIFDIISEKDVPAGAPVALRLTYTFENGETGVVEYVDYNINNYALRKRGSVGVAIRKDAAEAMFEAWRNIL